LTLRHGVIQSLGVIFREVFPRGNESAFHSLSSTKLLRGFSVLIRNFCFRSYLLPSLLLLSTLMFFPLRITGQTSDSERKKLAASAKADAEQYIELIRPKLFGI